MKSFVLSLVVLATAYSSSAQIYTGPVSITAHEVGTMANQYDKWHTSWGSYDRTVVATKTIEMSIRNFKNTAIKTTVTVYFVSHGAEAGQAIQDFEFDRSGEITSRVTSPQSISRVLNLELAQRRTVSGKLPITNWYIVARTNGRIIAIRGSDPNTQSELDAKVRSGAIH